ncbi:11283_t:CDS:2 [Diversispora eburnea]|uniref:11283_t:CDS:1 n=1 Tax=Diversispora eburnea TaxID=1213867 RepID=A0A9N8ZBD9_9GLOM|nr:11283_t:CDS:2 [Diversispora eburnea]
MSLDFTCENREIIPLIIPTSKNPNGRWITINEAKNRAFQRYQKYGKGQLVPYYMLPVLGTLPSVHHVYAEWYFGLDDNPSIDLLLKTNGDKWKNDNKARLVRRSFLIEEIKMREFDFTTAEVLVLLDLLKGKDKLNKLVDVKLLNRKR